MDTLKYVGTLQDRLTALACIAERAFMRTLEGGCSAPVAAHAEITDGGSLRLEGGVWSLNGEQELRADMERKLDCEEEEGEAEVKKRKTLEEQMPEFASVVASGSMKEGEMRIAETLGEALANKLLEKGAGKILAQAKAENSS